MMDHLALLICLFAGLGLTILFFALLRKKTGDLSELGAGALILNSERRCISVVGRFREMLELPAGWDPKGRHVSDVVKFFVMRGDYGPRASDSKSIDGDWFLSSDFEEIYLDTPSGNVVGVSVLERSRGGWVLTYTDMTRMKEQARMLFRIQQDLAASEAKAQQLAKEADAANQAKSAFLAAMTHEIRTPMNGVIGMADLLAETELNTEQRSCVETIGHSAESLLRIINDILDFSKIEAGKLTIDRAPMNLLTAVEDVLMLVSANAREKELQLSMAYSPELSQGFEGDSLRLRQILINLIGNAIKFTEKGSVHVAVSGVDQASHTDLLIEVSDTGIGIPEHDLGRIFGEFDQVDQSSKRRFEGTGLGLAITRRLVTLMHGKISVRSTLGVGTTFSVSLRLPRSQEVEVHNGGGFALGEAVCFVSRSASERQLAAAWLTAAGAEVRVSSDAKSLQEQARPFGIVVIDVPSLGADPAVTLASLQALHPVTTFVLACWPNEDRELQRGPGLRSAQRIYKPLRPSQLIGLRSRTDETPPVQHPAVDTDKTAQTLPGLKLSVLIADDNKTNRLIAQKMLAQTDLELHFACNGAEAIEMFQDILPDLVFMDLSMPGVDGFEATATIRNMELTQSTGRPTPIIALTANVAESDRDRCISVGMTDFLTKPIVKNALFSAIKKYGQENPPAGLLATAADRGETSSLLSKDH